MEQDTLGRANPWKGAQLWKNRTKHGRAKLFSDGELLRFAAEEYFAFIDANPWKKNEIVRDKDSLEGYQIAQVSLGRPYTIHGLCAFLGVSSSYFNTARDQLRAKAKPTDEDKDVLDALEMIETVVRSQQIEGGLVRAFDSNIVSKINGLVDRSDVTSGERPVMTVTVRDQATQDALDGLADIL